MCIYSYPTTLYFSCKDDTSSGVNHGATASDYEAYYVKSEEHQQQHQAHMNPASVSQHLQVVPPPPPDPNDQRMTVTPELLGLMPGATSQYSSGELSAVVFVAQAF